MIIVTGSNSGIGYESVKIFAAKGAKVVMACRSMDKANEALAQILKEKTYLIARRTVAKYREQLGIPVARLRREL